ncbi:hypothetical protein IVB41_08250 [Bradyrhizobium sp. 44]|uniref:hypothetical protein n=1 Tax=Bradyrhizobium sp. 44 TaxID=2782675 RepID=UPI001FFA1912|nr:hypothetical protein [Bradyrhizobium sp. 44]MCK1283928.1 hypothetical protein [Bradyrhizobium sp. 44]
MIAFAFEAHLNFFGAKLIDPWNERQRVNEKIKQVFGALEFSPDWQSRPFKGVQAMKELRDIFAHGKPATFEMDEVVEAEAGELDGKRYNLGPAWETLCMPVHVLDAYEDLVAVWKIMLARSGMAEFDAMDHGEGGVTYLGDVDQASNTAG